MGMSCGEKRGTVESRRGRRDEKETKKGGKGRLERDKVRQGEMEGERGADKGDKEMRAR